MAIPFGSDINLNNNKILNANTNTPTANENLANKKYVDDKSCKISLTGQLQVSSHRRSVIALCKVSTTDKTNLNSYSSGDIYFHRMNGLEGINWIRFSIENQYNKAFYFNFNYLSNLTLNASTEAASGVGFRPCTFKYNDEYYGGVEVFIDNAELDTVEFVGSTNFGIFGLDYYRLDYNDNMNPVIMNQEVYDSLNYTQYIINKQKLYGIKVDSIPSIVDVDSLPEITNDNRNRIIRYNGKLYSVSNKYTGTAQDLSIGADLSSAKLVLSFPDTLYSSGYSGAGNLTFVTTEGSAISSYNGSSNNYMCCISIGTHGLYGSQIYSANTNTKEVYTNMKSYIMPSNAGKITELKDLSAVLDTGFYVDLTPYIKYVPATEAWICTDNEIAIGESEPTGQEKLWIDGEIETEDVDITQKVTEEIEKQTKLEVIPNTEIATNEYIDGKRVYIKQLEFTDTFNSASPLTKAHGIIGATKVWIDSGNSYIIQNNACYPLPLNCFMGNFNDQIGLSVNLTELYIHSQTGWNEAWKKVVRLKYIK